MTVNAYRPHVLVLPEDDANRQIANGFMLDAKLNRRVIQVLPIARGWLKVVEKFNDKYVAEMRTLTERRTILLVDFDNIAVDRKRLLDSKIPGDIRHRVFVLGVVSEPEKLTAATKKTFETIGATLAQECAANQQSFWKHDLLKHNEPELKRLIEDVRPFLFN